MQTLNAEPERASRPVILIMVDYYLPGFRSGGPVRSVSNLVDHIGEQFDFYIVTRDKDWRTKERYAGISTTWNRVSNANVLYLPRISIGVIYRTIRELKPAVLFLNSFFSRFTLVALWMRRMGRLGNLPVLIAPRGELAGGALGFKKGKKKTYAAAAKAIGLYRSVTWLATSPKEVEEIRRFAGADADIKTSPNVGAKTTSGAPVQRVKQSGKARLVWMARISPVKNLVFALERLREIQGEIALDLFGEIDTAEYWSQCQQIIRGLPANINVQYRGVVAHEQVADTLAGYHAFYLPTTGENFGHAILEALSAGTPALISDRTPWRDLQSRHAGWDLPLEDESRWVAALQSLVQGTQAEFDELSQGAKKLAIENSGAGSGSEVASILRALC